jgi:hypothetical protein
LASRRSVWRNDRRYVRRAPSMARLGDIRLYRSWTRDRSMRTPDPAHPGEAFETAPPRWYGVGLPLYPGNVIGPAVFFYGAKRPTASPSLRWSEAAAIGTLQASENPRAVASSRPIVSPPCLRSRRQRPCPGDFRLPQAFRGPSKPRAGRPAPGADDGPMGARVHGPRRRIGRSGHQEA